MKKRISENFHTHQPPPPCPRLLIPVLCLLFALLGDSSRTTAGVLEQVAAHNAPPFFDDLDRHSLKAAVTHSLVALRQKSNATSLAFGEGSVSVARVRTSLETFYTLLETHEDLAAAVTQHFDIYQVSSSVLFTGYHEPVLNGSLVRTARYRYPLYRRPDDLVEVPRTPEDMGKKRYGRWKSGKLVPYFTRAEIDGQGILEGRQYELVWVDDPVARFFLHIQGSGQIRLPDGTRLRVGYAAANGHTYQSIGKLLLKQGKLYPGNASASAIHRYLYAHPDQQNQIFFYNQRYIFFRPIWDGPRGSLGVPLTPGRSLATDPTVYPPGALGFIRTKKPVLNQQEKVTWHDCSRFILLQDSGAAITGSDRADLFWGSGAQPEAGYMAQEGQLYLLMKKP